MSDYNDLVRFKRSTLSTAIQQYPSGRFGIVGSIPIECTIEHTNSIGQKYNDSKTYNTREEVIADLRKVGVTRCQDIDCKWINL